MGKLFAVVKTDTMLENAKSKLGTGMVIGYDINGNIYCDTNVLDGGEVLWLLENVKQRMLNLQPAQFV